VRRKSHGLGEWGVARPSGWREPLNPGIVREFGDLVRLMINLGAH